MTATTEEVTDRVETLILMALDANHTHQCRTTPILRNRTSKTSSTVLEIHDQGDSLPFETMCPDSAYTHDLVGGRIYATHHTSLAAHPAEVLGDEAEIALFSERDMLFKWRGFRRLPRPPKGLAWLGIATHWYEMHQRIVSQAGHGTYTKRVIPIDRSGNPLPATYHGNVICMPGAEGITLILCASVIEDALRANTMLAQVRDATEIKFPVPIGCYKSVFAGRDGPWAGDRRKAIVHWVASHLRRSLRGTEHVVQEHTRGVQEFRLDGMRVRLSPCAWGATNRNQERITII